MQRYLPNEPAKKIIILIIGSVFFAGVLIIRLFSLQVLQHEYYQKVASREQLGYVEIPAQRGEIVIKDYHSDEEFLVATNTTLNLIYADPVMVKDPIYVADKLYPLLFDLEDERAVENERINEAAKKLPADITEEEKAKILTPMTDKALEENFRTELINKISEKIRTQILLSGDLTATRLQTVKSLRIPGIEVKGESVYAYPSQISDKKYVAEKIAPYVEIPATKLIKILKGENRYVVLKRKLAPAVSDQITKMMKKEKEKFLGIGMKEEYFRYYPEGSLAANIIGYTNHKNIGQYGIESTFNTALQGKAGKFESKADSLGRQITVGESVLEAAQNGDDIVLTIDRSIQLETEKVLEEATKMYQADSGQILIMDPKTGAILAMAHYPTFDPNAYGDIFKKVEISLTPEEIADLYPTKEKGVYYKYTNPVTLDKHFVFEQKDDEGNVHYYRYENFVGPEVYHNKIVSWPYEPGSVFKPIIMAAAIDDGDVTPNTTFNDSGPVGVDWNVYKQQYDFEIKNVLGYFGMVNMTTVIAKSLNTGMTFVAKKIGPALMYSYLEKFGFLDRTDVEFDTESVGKIEYFDDWTESELATHAFGQGMTITMIQLANAYSALANGGILMQPHLIKEIRHDDGTVTKTEPREIRRVISEDTSAKMTAMLTYSVDNGEAKQGAVPGHYIAGKTGTAQTYKHGVALFGKGTTIASFAGYAPVDDPKFVMMVKFDRPKTIEWGSATAAPTFAKIAQYIFDYYNIPPDKK